VYIVAVVTDLIFQSKIEAAANRARVAVQCVRSPQAALEQLGGATALIVDGTLAGSAAVELVLAARARRAELPIVTFLPHVEVAQAEQMRTAGANETLARSQFDARLEDILRRLSARETS
jgi:DNA-binding NtrC family response regulator